MESVLILSLTFFITLSCYGQQIYDNYDGPILVADLQLFTTPIETVVLNLGSPDETTYEFWEMSEENVTQLKYNTNDSLFFTEDSDNTLRFYSFSLNTSIFTVSIGTLHISVGDHISVIQATFPLSYSNKGEDYIVITNRGGDHDYILIEFDPNNLIAKIEHRVF